MNLNKYVKNMTQTISFQKHTEFKQIIITHSYDIDVEIIWHAFTQTEILEKWWAPVPFKAVILRNEFKAGGSLLYYMLGPDETKHYCLAEFIAVDHLNSYELLDAFCDEKGSINSELPRMHWLNEFTTENGETIVTNTITFKTVEELEILLEMGFEAGYKTGLGQLYNLLN
jgi:uncharacterized protein YndB with AHSA1/START domain